MDLTPYHAKYYAYELTKRCSSDSIEKLAGAVAGAQVDLTRTRSTRRCSPFGRRCPRARCWPTRSASGKTIEAGLVLSQRWAERKRRILVIMPANLRKQWHQELTEKFFLPCAHPGGASRTTRRSSRGNFRPFELKDAVVICSYQFARNKAADVAQHAVGPGGHRRGAPAAQCLQAVQRHRQHAQAGACATRHKLLLTATPLQNSLLELFGLVSIIDEHAFGDLKSFREQFADLTQEQVFHDAEGAARSRSATARCAGRCTAYISYTNRLPLVEEFTPDESEDRLYDWCRTTCAATTCRRCPPASAR